jgi:hypothetical protein
MYNEEELASDLIQAVQAALVNYPFQWELIVVDDGSSDATWPQKMLDLMFGSSACFAISSRRPQCKLALMRPEVM